MTAKEYPISPIRLKKFNLNFPDRELEEKFRIHYFKRALGTVRLALITTIVIFWVFALFDKYASPDYYREFYVLRFFILTPFLLLLIASSYLSGFKRWWEELMFLAMLVTGGAIIYMVHRNPVYYYEGGIFLIITGGYLYIKLRFFKATLGGWLLIITYNLMVFFMNKNSGDPTNILITDAFLVSLNVICMIGLYATERLERLNFIRRKELTEKQNEIEYINSELENKVQRRTKDLMLAKEKAEESERLKSAFLANMSHEIRTPMNGILGFSELLTNPEITDEERRHFISVIHQSGHRLLNTVNDIMEISKIEAKQVEVFESDVDVIDILRELIDFFQPEAQKKGIDLNLSLSLKDDKRFIRSDRNKITSIFTNLIKNAIKYTDEGFVKLELSQENKHLIFKTIDSGIGIPPNRISAIFNRFEQADISDKRAKQGTGLGLSIANHYVEMLGGEISVKSSQSGQKRGTTFTVSLPLKQIKLSPQASI